MKSGRHTVVLGMAAGVGKTYRALDEVRTARESGRDAVIAYLEPHGRAATVARAQGLEVLPRRTVAHRDIEVTELDLPAALRRRPELALVDELAHTNAPGLEHGKRHEDVADLLAAGVDVVSTLNVQHLESLNDVVHELTGVRVTETLPDRVLAAADEVVLVDLAPETLLDRLRAGLIYPPDRVQAALGGFFRIENLSALREIALRQVAEDVEARRTAHPEPAEAVGERLLAWVDADATAQAVVRRAWRSSQRLHAPLDVLTVMPRRPPTPEEQGALDALSRLCGVLGLELSVVEGDDPLERVVDEAGRRGTTYLLLGSPPRTRLGRRGVVDRLLEALPSVDVRVVRDRA